MKNKTTFRVMLVVSAFVLLTLPSMINASSPSRVAAVAANDDCYEVFSACIQSGDYLVCLEALKDCTGE